MKKYVIRSVGLFLLFYILLVLACGWLLPMLQRTLVKDYYSNRVGTLMLIFVPALVFSCICGCRVLVHYLAVSSAVGGLLKVDLPELIVSAVLLIVLPFTVLKAVNGTLGIACQCFFLAVSAVKVVIDLLEKRRK